MYTNSQILKYMSSFEVYRKNKLCKMLPKYVSNHIKSNAFSTCKSETLNLLCEGKSKPIICYFCGI